jgi:hypothetical protein
MPGSGLHLLPQKYKMREAAVQELGLQAEAALQTG